MAANKPDINKIKKKIEKLIHLHSTLKADFEKMKGKYSELEKNVEQYKSTIKNLEDRNQLLKLSKSIKETNENPLTIKNKINELVREIDKCIAQLNT